MNLKTLTTILFIIILFLPMLLLGAVHWWSLGIITIIAASMLALLAADGKTEADLTVKLFLLMIAFTLFQIVPLPGWLVHFVSPAAFTIRQNSANLTGSALPFFIPISLDITFTLEELAKLLVYLSVYLTALKLIKQNGYKNILYMVSIAGAVASVILMAHKILLLQQVYGLYTPVHLGVRGDRMSAPLLNENHMAAFLSLCAAVTIGLAVSTRDRTKKMMLFTIFALVSASLLLTLSRGGIATFIVGQIVFMSMLIIRKYLRRKHKHSSDISSEQITWVPLALAAALALALFAAQDAIIGEFLNSDHKKIEIVNESLPLIKQFPFTGVGRGAFWVAFPMVSNWGVHVTYTHAENVIVQFLVDYGVVAGLLFIGTFIFIVARPLLAIPQKSLKAAAISALVAIGIHNLVDFNLEIPAVAILATVVLATVVAPSKRVKYSHQVHGLNKRWKLSGWIINIFAVVTLIMGAVVLLWNSSHLLEAQQIKIAQALKSKNSQYFKDNELHKVLQNHPADYYIPLIAGVYFFETGIKNPLPFLANATRLNKFAGIPHLYIGRYMLAHHHFAQGLLEMRLAATLNPKFRSVAAKDLVSNRPDFDTLQKIAVTTENKLVLWDALANAFAVNGNNIEAQKADFALLKFKNVPAGALIREANRMIAAKNTKRAIELSRKLQKLSKYKIKGVQLEATVWQKAGEQEKAIALLKKQLMFSPDDYSLLHQIIWAYQNNNNHEQALLEAKKLRLISATVKGNASAIKLEGDLEKQEGNLHMALSRYRQASMLLPDDIGILTKMILTARELGDIKQEKNAVERLKKIDPDNKEIKLHQLRNNNDDNG